MRVVHVNYDAAHTGGASIAMLRIHSALRLAGIDSIVACRALPDDPYSLLYKMSVTCRCKEFAFKVFQKITHGVCHSTGVVCNGMADFVNTLKPDIVQLHWLQLNTIGVRQLLKINCPIVWFTHDLWPMSGLNAHPETDWFKKGAPEGFWDKLSWSNKKEVVEKLGRRLTVVSPSEWAMKEAEGSIVFRNTKCYCIHCPVSELWIRAGKHLAQTTKPRNEKFTILFGATSGTQSKIKGWDRLIAAVKKLPQHERKLIRIFVFGETAENRIEGDVPVTFLGILNEQQLISQYFRADLFAFPSRRETWGQTKVESLCCGTPVITFNETACANGIRHKENGWISPEDDIDDYSHGLSWFIAHWMSGQCLKLEDEYKPYSGQAIANQWIDLYMSLLRGN
jgi:glycosyltransferase involved in cell wall biosynthesis